MSGNYSGIGIYIGMKDHQRLTAGFIRYLKDLMNYYPVFYNAIKSNDILVNFEIFDLKEFFYSLRLFKDFIKMEGL
jgi:hypothetical protein